MRVSLIINLLINFDLLINFAIDNQFINEAFAVVVIKSVVG